MAQVRPLYADGGAIKEASASDVVLAGNGSRLVTLEECVYAGLGTQTFSNGQSISLNGRTHVFTIPASSGAEITAAGLRFNRATASNAAAFAAIAGLPDAVVGMERFAFRPWQAWTRIVSYDFSAVGPPAVHAQFECTGDLTRQGCRVGRGRGVLNAANTSAGAPIMVIGVNASLINSPALAADAGDVYMINFATPFDYEMWIGDWSSGWPAMSSMRCVYAMRSIFNNTITQANRIVALASWWLRVGLECNGTAEAVFERWRITADG